MPLRSVEAASRDDAIEAAREQFGPGARVVGVRRVRSGGVLGFFATERYVAEVAPEPAGAAVVPAATPARPAGALTEDPDTGSLAAYGSPLAAASPARARLAPPRNGAAAWAAEAALVGATAAHSAPVLVGASAGASGRGAGLPSAPGSDELRGDELRVDELAGLLGLPLPGQRSEFAAAPVAEPLVAGPARTGVAPASFPRAPRRAPAPAALTDDDLDTGLDADLDTGLAPATQGAPSPFTAALARMVAGDREVQHAVREALDGSGAARVGEDRSGRSTWQPEPELTATTTDESTVWSRATHVEEETVGDQVIALPSPSLDERAEFSAWADEAFPVETSSESSALEPNVCEPRVPAGPADVDAAVDAAFDAEPPALSREEAIAEMLRAALAEGHSDDALAGILRKVLAGAPPQSVLPEPPAADARTHPADAPADVETEEGAGSGAAAATAPSFDLFSPATAAMPVAAPAPAPAAPAPVLLWGEVATPAPTTSAVPAPASDAQIWAETASAPLPPLFGEPLPEAAPATEVPAVEVPAIEVPADEVPASEVPPAQLPAAESTATSARPVTPSAPDGPDSTTVLTLLPGSSSRRGLPPVPPRIGRPAVPPSPARTPGNTDLLATVTRLPVAAPAAAQVTPDGADLVQLADLIEADESGLLDSPALPATGPTRVRVAPPRTPAEVRSRLAYLGVPADLLGASFLADVAAEGTYAALTRALRARLPEVPELPVNAGEVLFVVGPGVETLRAARSLAVSLRLDPDRVQWATRGDLLGLAPESSRMSTPEAAQRRFRAAASSGTVTVVAVDAPLRTDASWMSQLLAIWSPVAVWAVVEATRKPEDLEHWLDGLARVDALIVQDTELSADPAAVLSRLAAPVAVVDGVRATAHRWASVLCERLEIAPA